MYLTANMFKKYPYTVRGTGFGWGVLNTKADPPYIGEEFDTEAQAWAHIKVLNEQYWLEHQAQRAACWAIQKASEESLRPLPSGVFSSLWTRLKAVLPPSFCSHRDTSSLVTIRFNLLNLFHPWPSPSQKRIGYGK